MATVSLQDYDVLGIYNDFQSFYSTFQNVQHSKISYSWNSDVTTTTIGGNNLAVDVNGILKSGSVTSIEIAPVDGASLSFVFEHAISASGLVSAIGTDPSVAADHFWAVALAGDDTFSIPQLDVSPILFGDFDHVPTNGSSSVTVKGGDDTAHLYISPDEYRSGSATFVGDAGSVAGITVDGRLFTTTLKGGNDTISLFTNSFATAIGDADSVGVGGIVMGGNDKISYASKVIEQLGESSVVEIGDVRENDGGTVYGGDDKIIGPTAKSEIHGLSIIGDVDTNLSGRVIGGNDYMTMTGVDTFAAGDVGAAAGEVIGGNDYISGGASGFVGISGDVGSASDGRNALRIIGGDDTILSKSYSGPDAAKISGDVLSGGYILAGSVIHGGNDNITGGSSAETIYGDIGEILTIKGKSDIRGGNDLIHGGGGDDYIYGDFGPYTGKMPAGYFDHGGRDTLYGDGGDDHIYGNAGNDTLIGGTGADVLKGGSGADRFVYQSISSSTVASSGRDTIVDFAASQGDRLDLHAIDANSSSTGNQTFKFIGTDYFSHHAGELRFAAADGDTYVYADTNGDGKSDFSIKLDGSIALTAHDFIL